MKIILMLAGVLLGIALGLATRIDKPRPRWWQTVVLLLLALTLVLAIVPPIAGSFADVVMMDRAYKGRAIPVKIHYAEPASSVYDENTRQYLVRMQDFSPRRNTVTVRISRPELALFDERDVVVAMVRRGASDTEYEMLEVLYTNPLLTLPYIPGLEERARNLFLHVPMSWTAVIAFCMSMIYALRYLRTKDMRYDVFSAATAEVGLLFTVLATTTGMVWATFDWGTPWNWDPRQTSIFLLLLIYGAYFALRSSIDQPEKRASLGAVYAILSFVTVPFLMFVMPRLMQGLHPGSAGSGSAGPVLSQQADSFDPVKQVIFSLSLAAFIALYFWLLSLLVRFRLVDRSVQIRLQELA